MALLGRRSRPELREYLAEQQEIEGLGVEGGNVEAAKLAVIKEKRTRNQRLQKKWGAPEPPWNAVPSNIALEHPQHARPRRSR